jgi:hypothetical protein
MAYYGERLITMYRVESTHTRWYEVYQPELRRYPSDQVESLTIQVCELLADFFIDTVTESNSDDDCSYCASKSE